MPGGLPLPRVELWQGRTWFGLPGRWYFHRLNRNGRVTQPSQGYMSRRGARRAAHRDVPGVPIVVLPAPPNH